MKILMLSWEYPPAIVGGLGRAVADLSEALENLGNEVHVLTGESPANAREEVYRGVQVYRVGGLHPDPINFLDSVLYLNFQLIERAIQLYMDGWQWDVIHAHDWLVTHCAKVLKHSFKRPLIATIHATEFGRNQGIHTDLQYHINSVEWWLAYEAYQVICCSNHMYHEIQRLFQTPEDKLSVLPNGVDMTNFAEVDSDLEKFRSQFAEESEKIVFYVGRLVHEKGVDSLLEAVPIVNQSTPTKFIIAGKGPEKERLEEKARQLGIAERVQFVGFVDDLTRNSLYRVADAAVFPSLYEPFGIVALEAMACLVPVVVGDVGGFREIIRSGENGLTFTAGDSHALAHSLLSVLEDPELADRLRNTAFEEVKCFYDWRAIARNTVRIYRSAGKKLPPQAGIPWSRSSAPYYERYQQT